ncbi:uncharacterized protein LOC132044375 [Lycium ferocissimum]|uniref:uncharacterized protein LOC132044375 n=1 Tax=Lycium ferocissimum TaxID=112874 RepID=UPI0028168B59|nr:uncharacterized protein LOC132044375 [Lycium ferocissimum]
MSDRKRKTNDTQMEKNLRCRIAYKEMPPDQKAALLERRRVEYAARRHTLSENSTPNYSTQKSMISGQPTLGQPALFIRETPSSSRSDLSNFYIALKCDSALDQRTYNLPSVSEVAAIWTDEELDSPASTPHIRVYTHSNTNQLVHYYYGCYDALQYPLLFPYGENGWHCGIQRVIQKTNSPRNRSSCKHENIPSVSNMSSIDGFLNIEEEILQKERQKKNTVSCREYYCYKLQIRDDEENDTLHSGRVFQQFSVDQYIKVETQRLDFLLFNQDLFRIEVLAGLIDLLRLGEREASNIGRKTFLPASFTGGPRDMRRRYMDAIALVQHFGKPDIFLTMTCNPSWP